MGRSKLDEVAKQRCKKLWAEGNHTIAALVDEFGVSEGTIKRIIKGIPKGSARSAVVKATATVIDEAVKAAIAAPTGSSIEGIEDLTDLHFANVLRAVAQESLSKGQTMGFNSAGEAVSAGINALKALRSLYPLTMREAAEWVVNLPGFNAKEFARLLREVWDEKRSA